ncbi:MAG: hypothetical protein OEQ47_17265, partial [Acidimicrobiia bacterium]|nr:hypothetical protein [Acidimicrobiia bacterium]
YESWDELLDHYGRRLVLPKAERHALRALIEPDVVSEGGRLRVGDTPTRFATIVIHRSQMTDDR